MIVPKRLSDLHNTRLFKEYFRGNGFDNPTIEKWFNDLDRFTRKEINIKCEKSTKETDLYID